jgi:hypothetical protein
LRLQTFVAVLLLGAFAGAANAAHPLISEDTGTQGTGTFELELGNSFTRDAGVRVYEFDPQLSYGVVDTVDLIVRPSWLSASQPLIDNGERHGLGGTTLDFKWRFYEQGNLSVGTRAGLDLPTAARGLGFRTLTAHALLVATLELTPVTVTSNIAYQRLPDTDDVDARRNIVRLSTAGIWAINEQVKLVADIAAFSPARSGRTTWPANGLIGIIATVKKDFDVDAGYETRLNHVAVDHVLLVGATVRW